MNTELCWNDTERNSPKNSEQGLYQCHLPTANPKLSGVEMKAELRCENPANNLPSHDVAIYVIRSMTGNKRCSEFRNTCVTTVSLIQSRVLGCEVRVESHQQTATRASYKAEYSCKCL
jgi:hypothetical protein